MPFDPKGSDKRLKVYAFAVLAAVSVIFSFAVLAAPKGKPIELDEKVYVNSDPIESILRLPTVGITYGKRFIEIREQANGEKVFTTEDDLKKVRGIGEVRASQIAPHVSYE